MGDVIKRRTRSNNGNTEFDVYDNTPIYEEAKEYFEYLKSKGDEYYDKEKVYLSRINQYSELFSKHMIDFDENEIIQYLVKNTPSLNVIQNNAYGADRFIEFLGKKDEVKFSNYIKEAEEEWKQLMIGIIDFNSLEKIINEIYMQYPFYQVSAVLLLLYSGIDYHTIDTLKYEDIDFKRRIIELTDKEVYINDKLLYILLECKKKESFVVPGMKKNSLKIVSDTDYIISGLENVKNRKEDKKDSNFRSYQLVYKRIRAMGKQDEWLPIINLLSYSGMLNEFAYSDNPFTKSSIEDFLLKYSCIKATATNNTWYTSIRQFKMRYEEYENRNNKYVKLLVNYTRSKEIVDEYPDDETSENGYFDYEFEVPAVLPQNDKLDIAVGKSQKKIEVGNKSEEYVMGKYTNAIYVKDECGYDIHDYDTKICIEVKTVNKYNNFIITINELIAAEKFAGKYLLYLVKYRGDKPFDYMRIHDPVKYFNIDMKDLRKSFKNNKGKLTPKSFTIKV